MHGICWILLRTCSHGQCALLRCLFTSELGGVTSKYHWYLMCNAKGNVARAHCCYPQGAACTRHAASTRGITISFVHFHVAAVVW